MQTNSRVSGKITDRILYFLELKGITKYKFHKDLGLSNGFLDKSREIGTDKYAKILEYLPDINPDWLLTGRGSMLRGDAEEGKGSPGQGITAVRDHQGKGSPGQGITGVRDPVPGCGYCREKEKLIAAQQRTIDILERELHHCKALYDEEREKEKGHPTDGQKRKAG